MGDDIANKTDLKIDCGGGIKTIGDVEMLFSLGAYAVNLGSVAVKNPAVMTKCLEKYGPDKIILSADVNGETVRINGWQSDAGTTIGELIEKFLPAGLQRVCVTAIKCDGPTSYSTNAFRKNTLTSKSLPAEACQTWATSNALPRPAATRL